ELGGSAAAAAGRGDEVCGLAAAAPLRSPRAHLHLAGLGAQRDLLRAVDVHGHPVHRSLEPAAGHPADLPDRSRSPHRPGRELEMVLADALLGLLAGPLLLACGYLFALTLLSRKAVPPASPPPRLRFAISAPAH